MIKRVDCSELFIFVISIRSVERCSLIFDRIQSLRKNLCMQRFRAKILAEARARCSLSSSALSSTRMSRHLSVFLIVMLECCVNNGINA